MPPPTGFTIAIPTHDRRETVLLAARSALAQTRPAEQVIVLCDACTDGSAEALRALGDERLEVLDLPKLPGYAYGHRNTALERARGEAILWLGDDDLLLPDHLERLGEYWDAGSADLVSTPGVIVHPDDGLEWFGEDWGIPRFRDGMAVANTNVMASVSVRASLVREVGGWDASLPRFGDWDLWRRCAGAGARAWTTAEPTVLHFRATGRVQEWPDRVRQNSAWWGRISDPGELRDVRHALRRARGLRDALIRDDVDARAAEVADLRAAREDDDRRRRELDAELEALQAERDALQADRKALQADRDAARATLSRIYAGGWWRLRGRLRALLRRP